MQSSGGDQRHHAHHAFGQHGTESDRQNVVPLVHQFRGGAGADKGVEAGDGTTGDGNGDKGPDRAAQYRAAAVDELGHGGELDLRVDADNADDQGAEHADLHKAGDVAAWGEQQPDRQRGSEEGVDGQSQTYGLGTQGQPGTEGALLHVGAEEDAGQHGDEAHPGGRLQVAGQLVPNSHHHGDGDGHEHREHAPGVTLQRVHHHHGETRHGDGDDEQHRKAGTPARDGAKLGLGHLGE